MFPILEVLEEAIDEIQEQVVTDDSFFIKRLKEFQELVQGKLLKYGRRTPERDFPDFQQKIDSMLEKKNQLQKKLQALNEYKEKELDFRNEIIKSNNALNVERKKQFDEVMAAERAMYEQEITLAKRAFQTREDLEYRSKIEETNTRLDKSRTTNVTIEREQRKEWYRKLRTALEEEVLDEYDTRMTEQQNELELLTQLHEHETRELQRYVTLCKEQNELYHDLMREKEEYLEGERQRKLYEIRVKLAKRTIVKFVEQYYPMWKKKKLKATKKKNKYRSRYAR